MYVRTTENSANTAKMMRIVHLRLRKMRSRSRRLKLCSRRSPPRFETRSGKPGRERASAVPWEGRSEGFTGGESSSRHVRERVDRVERVAEDRVLQDDAARGAVHHDHVVVHHRRILDLAAADALDV